MIILAIKCTSKYCFHNFVNIVRCKTDAINALKNRFGYCFCLFAEKQFLAVNKLGIYLFLFRST